MVIPVLWYTVFMNKTEFDSLKRGDVLRSAAGKLWLVTIADADDTTGRSSRYVYAVRCNEAGNQDGLTNREQARGTRVRNAANYERVAALVNADGGR